MLTVNQISEKLSINRATTIKLINNGEIRAIRVGDQYRIPEESFEQFMTASQVSPSMTAGTKEYRK